MNSARSIPLKEIFTEKQYCSLGGEITIAFCRVEHYDLIRFGLTVTDITLYFN